MLELQKELINSGATLPLEFRIRQLKALYKSVKSFEDEICSSLHADLGKSREESYMTEIGVVLSEIRYAINHIKKWTAPKTVLPPLTQFYSTAKIISEPFGVCLIISPWNYPFLLTISPLISAISAGNCAVIKPSDLSPHTSAVIESLISSCFDPAYCTVIQGGAKTASAELKKAYDMIFFTGSPRIGKIVMQAAAENLTPVVLELGGKSPCIVDKTANISVAAKRIVWGKLINAGQTCVAPDYILVDRLVKDRLISEICKSIKRFYGSNPMTNSEYPKIINRHHFDRLVSLMDDGEILFGGSYSPDDLRIEPTILSVSNMTSTVMTEEIFGPILPIVEYESLDKAVKFVKERPKPLAFYLFTKNKNTAHSIMTTVPFGGGCVNDTVSHIIANNMPFGGVGQSGIGYSHGRYGFNSFSHQKSVLCKSPFPDIPLRYPPFKKHISVIKKLMK